MTKGTRYAAPLVLLLVSSVGVCYCSYSMMFDPSVWIRTVSVVGVVMWLFMIGWGLCAIRKGRRPG